MAWRTVHGFWVLSILASGCVTAPGYLGPDLLRTSETAPRHQYRYFSAEPPRGHEWRVRVSEQTPAHCIFRKDHTPTHSFFVGVDLLARFTATESAADTAERLRQNEIRDRQRFTERGYEQVPDESWGRGCVSFQQEIVDTGAVNAPGTPLLLASRGFVCPLDTSPPAALQAVCSERGLEDEVVDVRGADCETFLRSIRIERAPGRPAD